MTGLSETEKLKALLDAAERLLERIDHDGGVGPYKGGPAFVVEPFRQALRAYDPPKPKVPQIPAWEEFAQGRFTSTTGRIELDENVWIDRFQYEVIRTLTSKEAE